MQISNNNNLKIFDAVKYKMAIHVNFRNMEEVIDLSMNAFTVGFIILYNYEDKYVLEIDLPKSLEIVRGIKRCANILNIADPF